MECISPFSSEELGVILELGPLYHMKYDLTHTIKVLRKRLCDVHLHNAFEGGTHKKFTHLPIGQGTLDFTRILNVIREVEYDGSVTLEVKRSEHEILSRERYPQAGFELEVEKHLNCSCYG